MKIALVGYGKMGKIIEELAIAKGHTISYKISSANTSEVARITPQNTDVVIEFTQPEAAYTNVATCLKNGVPVVCGTTGWAKKQYELEKWTKENKGAFLWASNFSIGVNLFFALNKHLAALMAKHEQYKPEITEIHHTEKKDQPSGTGITLAEGLLAEYPQLGKWVNRSANNSEELGVISVREPNVPGTHTISYTSDEDTLSIEHTAHNRKGFAKGALLAAEWIIGKKGVFRMQDLLSL